MLGTLITGVSAGRKLAKALTKKKKRRPSPGLSLVEPVRSTSTSFGTGFTPGADIDVMSEEEMIQFEKTGEFTPRRRRRRRRRLLTSSDRADIAFITGVLGKGQSGQAAIATLLARCN